MLMIVRDSGTGIAPEQLPKILDPFTQLSPSGAEGGLGIGLTLAKRLVELHGGEVAARSAGIGTGSEFVVRLPALEVALPLARPPCERLRSRGSRDICASSS